MKLASFFLLRHSLLLLAGLQSAAAAPVKWTLSNVHFDDGASASGSFTYDAATDEYSSIDIKTTSGSSITGSTYGDPLSFASASFLNTVPDDKGDHQGKSNLIFLFETPLSDSGGTRNLISSFEGPCGNTACSFIGGFSFRGVISGQVKSATMPSPDSPQPTPTNYPTPSSSPLTYPEPSFEDWRCFSGANTVEVLTESNKGKGEGKITKITDLEVGDFVRAGDGQFSRVIGFLHLDDGIEAEYLQIYIAGQYAPLELGPAHTVFFTNNNSDSYAPIPASEIQIGDILNEYEVIDIQLVERQGVYAPLTESGDIVVSGILASCWPSSFVTCLS